MIIRHHSQGLLILTQRDHAALSAELASVMDLSPFDEIGERETLLRAIRHHDDGWEDWDAKVLVDPKLGRPRGFHEMKREDSLPIWTKSVGSVERLGPLAALAVAGHFLRLSELGEQDTLVSAWRNEMEKNSTSWLECWLSSGGERNKDMAKIAVEWLRFFDSFSLNLCRGADTDPFPLTRPNGMGVGMAWQNQEQVHIDSWPFKTEPLRLALPAQIFSDGILSEQRLTLHFELRPTH